MIPMSCPSCGRKGNIPLDRLNTRMHCKKCDAVFHMDASGKPVLGEPPSSKANKVKTARAANEPLDPIGIVAAKLAQTPKPVWLTGLVIFSLVLLYYGYGVFGPSGPTEDESLNTQIHTAAKAVLDKDMATLKKMTTADSQEEMAQAVDAFHGMLGPIAGKTEDINMLLGPAPQGTDGCVEITITPSASDPASIAAAATGTSPPTVNMDICWIQGEKGRWYINGKAMLDMVKSRVEIKKKMKK